VSAKSEYEAAYFTLLRAREEHTELLRYSEFLEQERHRLEEVAARTRTAEDELPRRLRRPIGQTSSTLLQAIGARRNIVLSEQSRMPDRISAAQDFVDECESEVNALGTL
jgi:hypothetical protein